jgi:hypothetical protein
MEQREQASKPSSALDVTNDDSNQALTWPTIIGVFFAVVACTWAALALSLYP